MTSSAPITIDEYIALYPAKAQAHLRQLRSIVQSVAPGAVEVISYAIPTFLVNDKAMIHFAAWKKHVSLYPFTSEMAELLPETHRYKTSGKGTIQFSLDEPLPVELIKKILTIQLEKINASAT